MENKFKKQGVGDFISSSFKLTNSAQLVSNIVFALGSIGVLGFLGYTLLGGNPQQIAQNIQNNPGAVGPMLFGMMIVMMIAIFIVLVSVFHSQSEYYQGKQTSYGESVKTGLAKFFPLLLSMICVGFMVGGVYAIGALLAVGVAQIHPALSIVVIIPLIIYMIYLYLGIMMVMPSLIVENAGPIEAIKRSMQISKGSRGTIFVRFFVLNLVIALLQLVIQFIAGMVLQALAGSVVMVIIALLPIALAYFYFSLVGAAGITVMYFDLRATKESFGIEKLAENFD